MHPRRFPPTGALLLTAVILTLGPGAWASHGPQPEVYGDTKEEENNPTCAWLGQQRGQTWNELKIDQAPANGAYDDQGSSDNPGGPGSLTLTVSDSDGYVFDWSSNIGVDAVVVKGGNRGSNVYLYDPEATADHDLQSPLNTKGRVPQISHVSACYDEEQGGQQQGGGDGDSQQQGDGNQEQGDGRQGEQQGGDGDGQQQGGGDGDGQQPGERNSRQQDDGDGQDQGDGQGDGGQQTQGDRRDRGDRQEDGGAQQESGSGGGDRNERTAQDEREADDDSRENQRGEGGVLGESESNDGIAEEDEADADEGDDDEEDEDDEERDRLPFTGAPVALVLFIGLMLLLTGLTGRRASSR